MGLFAGIDNPTRAERIQQLEEELAALKKLDEIEVPPGYRLYTGDDIIVLGCLEVPDGDENQVLYRTYRDFFLEVSLPGPDKRTSYTLSLQDKIPLRFVFAQRSQTLADRMREHKSKLRVLDLLGRLGVLASGMAEGRIALADATQKLRAYICVLHDIANEKVKS
jgi:hypothetical protein